MDVWKTRLETRERGLENCYLMTNGLGGFSSMTMTGAVSRNDHALLMACTTAPNCRYNMIHRLKEELLTETGDVLTLSTQEFEEQTPEDGYLHLAAFSYEDTPIWRFLVNGVEIKKRLECHRKKIQWRFIMKSKPQQPECGICADSIFPVRTKGSRSLAGSRKSYLQKEPWKVKE